MSTGTYQLLVDWNNNGSLNGTNEDVTQYVRGLSSFRGRDYASQLIGRSIGGRLRSQLRNDGGTFSSFNANSPLAGSLLPGRAVQFRRVPPLGQYLEFANGGTGSVLIPNVGSIENIFSGGWCFEALIRPESTGEGGAGHIFFEPGSTSGFFIFVNNQSGGTMQVRLSHRFTGANATWRTNAVWSTGTWARVSINFNSDDSTGNDPTIMQNGTALTVAETDSGSGTAGAGTSDKYIGNNDTGAFQFRGGIDDVRLWNTTRTTADVRADMFLELTGTETNLRAYWRLHEGSGTVVADSAGTATGTLTEPDGTWSFEDSILWSGFLSSINPMPSIAGLNMAVLEAEGPLTNVNTKQVQIAMQTDIPVGTAVGTILDDAGWPSGDRDIDVGQTTMVRFWVDRQKTLSALRIVESTEAGFIYETKDGKIKFENRHHRLQAPHTTSTATFTDEAGGTLSYLSPVQQDPLKFIYNEFIAEYNAFSTVATATLWVHPETGADSPAIEPSEVRSFWATYPNATSTLNALAVDSWRTPASGTDFTANAETGGGGTDLTPDIALSVTKFSQAMKITLDNTGTTKAFVTLLSASGVAITKADPVLLTSEDGTSQTAYGTRSFRNPSPFLPSSKEAQDWCDYNIGIFADPIPILSMPVIGNKDGTHLNQVTRRDISDRITVVATGSSDLGIGEDFFIEAERHRIDARKTHIVTWDLSPVADFAAFWVLNVGSLGTTTRLAY